MKEEREPKDGEREKGTGDRESGAKERGTGWTDACRGDLGRGELDSEIGTEPRKRVEERNRLKERGREEG